MFLEQLISFVSQYQQNQSNCFDLQRIQKFWPDLFLRM